MGYKNGTNYVLSSLHQKMSIVPLPLIERERAPPVILYVAPFHLLYIYVRYICTSCGVCSRPPHNAQHSTSNNVVFEVLMHTVSQNTQTAENILSMEAFLTTSPREAASMCTNGA